jgi:4-carboxymuconolactone decarboxylase
VESYERTLCRLAIGDEAYADSVLACDAANRAESGLDLKTHAFVRLAGLIASDAAAPSYLGAIESARAGGASDEEIVGCLVAVMPALGAARVVSAAPKLGIALGYDVTAALEEAGVPPPA